MSNRKADPLDYEKIARLERELGLAPALPNPVTPALSRRQPVTRPFVNATIADMPMAPPHPAPPPPPADAPRVPVDALYVCTHCGNRVKAGAIACNHCGGDTWRRDDD